MSESALAEAPDGGVIISSAGETNKNDLLFFSGQTPSIRRLRFPCEDVQLPRQARDKHKESGLNHREVAVFYLCSAQRRLPSCLPSDGVLAGQRLRRRRQSLHYHPRGEANAHPLCTPQFPHQNTRLFTMRFPLIGKHRSKLGVNSL